MALAYVLINMSIKLLPTAFVENSNSITLASDAWLIEAENSRCQFTSQFLFLWLLVPPSWGTLAYQSGCSLAPACTGLTRLSGLCLKPLKSRFDCLRKIKEDGVIKEYILCSKEICFEFSSKKSIVRWALFILRSCFGYLLIFDCVWC